MVATEKASTRATDAQVEKIVFDPGADRGAVAEQALSNPNIMAALLSNLSTEARRVRQFSASALSVVSETQPEVLRESTEQIIDALHRPEAQTRWECLEILTRIVAMDAKRCDSALIGAETSLYDEESGNARLAAMRFICAYGAVDAKRSQKVWSMIDEAIQCYHGDAEFLSMLSAVTGFASGQIDKEVKKSLANRMDFDANNAKGTLKRRAAQIIELCKKK